MPLVPAKCTNCGAILTIDSSKDAAICEYCKTPFVTEKAINNYSIQNSVIHIHQEAEKKDEFEIVAGTLLSYNSKNPEVVIPENVTKIGASCFSGLAITSVKFPKSLIYIDDCAFAKCPALKRVEIPSNVVQLGTMVFSGCKMLEYAYYPASIQRNAGSTFEFCTSLKEIKIEDGVTNLPVDFARECSSLENIELPNTLERIYTNAFFGTGLKNLTIPNSVEFIDINAFANCKFLNIVFIQTATNAIAENAFDNTPWQSSKWASEGKCPHCGGNILFGRCLNCFDKIRD